MLPSGQQCHDCLVNPCALPVPKGSDDFLLDNMFFQGLLSPVVRRLDARCGDEGEPVVEAVAYLLKEPLSLHAFVAS